MNALVIVGILLAAYILIRLGSQQRAERQNEQLARAHRDYLRRRPSQYRTRRTPPRK